MESSQKEKEIYNNVAGTIKLEWKQKLMEVCENLEKMRFEIEGGQYMGEELAKMSIKIGFNKCLDQAISLIKKAIDEI